ncbi:hypothetical protein JQ629_22865 [Bradyrhizobium sp. AUGA SZCCT0222]|uniref:hypothetical protein n=1 Tax=Bradyrhizobium sp. AUGA SZCCT0222 TaxID=2807668 RepID=UPI001BA52346|nr:hypothetical protein [Bradyrhizobium sp. AUGA SZCCT0222]MBR1270321.1 hypothetical protein [Bradyrhizobium sp. AUGA SZCCT0222]
MKLLLLAESQTNDIALRATTVALQITHADGGEDGRVEWSGGVTSTDYFPSTFCIFQAKAQNLTDASIKRELLKKSKVRSGRGKTELNQAILDVLANKGAYIIFSSAAFTGPKIKKLKDAAKASIRAGKKHPSHLAAIEVYDANKIATWVNSHPAVALWLAERERKRHLAGFQTHEGWAKSADITTGPWIPGDSPRFIGVNVQPADNSKQTSNREWTFDEVSKEVSERLANSGQLVRIFGPSGFGKSRFAYEILKQDDTLRGRLNRASTIYADASIVGDEVGKLALEIADSGASAVLVIDECPDDMHLKLANIAQRNGSKLRIVSMDVETKVLQSKNTLPIRLAPASDKLIEEIAKGVSPKLSPADTSFIHDVAAGFPQMAVLAAQQNADGRATFDSVDQLLNRILWGRRPQNADAQRALEVLSIFDWIGLSGEHEAEGRMIAHELAGLSFDSFVEHVRSFKSRGIVVERGSFAQVQPVPLAARLAGARWGLMPDGKMLTFFRTTNPRLQESILRRIRWLDGTSQARTFARTLLSPETFGNLGALNSKFGSELLDRLVHVDPDFAETTIVRVFGGLSIAQLKQFQQGRRNLVWALERLVFRRQSFVNAATLLRRLGAAETETGIGNNASGEFEQLYQLYLSGTEAEPSLRLQVLDEGLASSDPDEQAIAFRALTRMLDTGSFTRSGGAGEIGSQTRLVDWQPKMNGDIWEFYRAAIQRLLPIAISDDKRADAAMRALASHLRGLFRALPFEEIEALVRTVTKAKGTWIGGIQGLNSWLYYDSNNGTPAKLRKDVRKLFDELMPTDPVDLALLYAEGWSADFHDPDVPFDLNTNDFEYAARQLVEQAKTIARSPKLVDRALKIFVHNDAKSPFPLGRTLAEFVRDPVALFRKAAKLVERGEKRPNFAFFSGIIFGADQRNPDLARRCVRIALNSGKLRENAISMIGSGKLQATDLDLVVSLLKSGDVKPRECAVLSYGRGLDHLSAKDIMPLMSELTRHGSGGLWTVLDMLGMYLHGGKAMDKLIVDKLKSILTSPQLFSAATDASRNGHWFETKVSQLSNRGLITADFASRLTKQMLSICRTKDHDVFHHLDGPVQNAIKVLLPDFPKEVWTEVAKLLLTKDWLVRHRIERLLQISGEEHMGGGLLATMPDGFYLSWVRSAPKGRAAIPMHWLPVTTKTPDGKLSWTPEIEAYVREFGAYPGVMGQLATRLHPNSWWGSLAPLLEPLIPLVNEWTTHPLEQVRQWAREYVVHLHREIANANQRSEEDVVRFG